MEPQQEPEQDSVKPFTVGKLRQAIEGLPDETLILVDILTGDLTEDDIADRIENFILGIDKADTVPYSEVDVLELTLDLTTECEC